MLTTSRGIICLADSVLKTTAGFNKLFDLLYFRQWVVINQRAHSACFPGFHVSSRSPLKHSLGLELFLTSQHTHTFIPPCRRQPPLAAFLSGIWHNGPCSSSPCSALCCSTGGLFSSHGFSLYGLNQNLLPHGRLIFSLSHHELCWCSQGWHSWMPLAGLWLKSLWGEKVFKEDGEGSPSAIFRAAGPTAIGRMKLDKGPSHLSPCTQGLGKI